jgi:hypothetical protein
MELGVQQCRVAHWGVSFVLADQRDSLPSLGDRLTRFPRETSPFPSSNPIDYCQLSLEGSCSLHGSISKRQIMARHFAFFV